VEVTLAEEEVHLLIVEQMEVRLEVMLLMLLLQDHQETHLQQVHLKVKMVEQDLVVVIIVVEWVAEVLLKQDKMTLLQNPLKQELQMVVMAQQHQ
tara:strand:- start:273 stop:557 length:285 start_codon:yes stop_codon:yes gene_type:complete